MYNWVAGRGRGGAATGAAGTPGYPFGSVLAGRRYAVNGTRSGTQAVAAVATRTHSVTYIIRL
eukprot:COSAG02_NODE_8_length_60691_cov_104.994752_27_plen_63_part_00